MLIWFDFFRFFLDKCIFTQSVLNTISFRKNLKNSEKVNTRTLREIEQKKFRKSQHSNTLLERVFFRPYALRGLCCGDWVLMGTR